jgi:hypothetical protein
VLVVQSTMDHHGSVNHRTPELSGTVATAHQHSPAMAREGEVDTGSPFHSSPEVGKR